MGKFIDPGQYINITNLSFMNQVIRNKYSVFYRRKSLLCDPSNQENPFAHMHPLLNEKHDPGSGSLCLNSPNFLTYSYIL